MTETRIEKKITYIYMGSPLLSAQIGEELSKAVGPPVLVVTQLPKPFGRGKTIQPTPVEEWACTKAIPVFATENVNLAESRERITKIPVDLIIVVAFGQLIVEKILQFPKKYSLNLHMSLLPKYRGAAPVQRAIWNGEKETGVTIQKMSKKLDAGDILFQQSTLIGESETTAEVLERLIKIGAQSLIATFSQIAKGEERFLPQEESRVSYAKKIQKEEASIDWKEPAQKILNQIRALQPWPVAETTLGGEQCKIFAARVTHKNEHPKPIQKRQVGEIDTDGKSFLEVLCGDGQFLSVEELQLKNRKRLKIKDFLSAYRGKFPYTAFTLHSLKEKV